MDRLSVASPHGVRQSLRRLLLACSPSPLLRDRQSRSAPGALLTFDDGPDPDWTPAILDALAAAGVGAAFYLVGERAARHPELVRRIHDAGHLVGSHSWSHPARGALPATAYLADMQRGRAAIEQLTGSAVPAFRPPHGYLAPALLPRLWARGFRLDLWSVDPRDYASHEAETVVAFVTAAGIAPRDIVLLHDTSASTATAVRLLLASGIAWWPMAAGAPHR